MPRTQYQAELDLVRERQIAERFCERFGYEMRKSVFEPRYDFGIYKEGVLAGIIEVKRRWITLHNERFAPFVAAQKFDGCREIAGKLSVPFALVYGFNDVHAYYRYHPDHKLFRARGGRTSDTRDSHDVEMMVHIPQRYWKEL